MFLADTSQGLPFINLGTTPGVRNNSLSAVNDGTSGVIALPKGFPFANTTHTTVYVRF